MPRPATPGAVTPVTQVSDLHAYCMAVRENDTAEITMYGEIVEEQPRDWWTDEPIPGNYIIKDEFLKDLETVKGCSELTIRMDSLGGDANVSNLIHNRLRELARAGTHLTCIVDGAAMSGGSLIMCACDTVKVNASSLIMIHKCWVSLWGGYNADELRAQADKQDAYDKMQISIYKRKTGLSETVLSHMMSDTTTMTGSEAIDKGFADELIQDGGPAPAIAASADKRHLFVNGRVMELPRNVSLPDGIPTNTAIPAPAAEGADGNIQPDDTGEEGGHNVMTLAELREQHPDEYAQLVSEIQAGVDHTAAVQAERDRLKDIDEVASLFSSEMVQEAKYGATACDAKELAFRAAKAAAQAGQKFLTNLEADNNSSGANGVGTTPNAGAIADNTTDIKADAKKAVEMFVSMKKEVR